MQNGTTTGCKSTTRNGQPCQANAGPSGYCWAHDPAYRERRRQARRDGGKARHGRRIHWSDDQLLAGIHIGSVADVVSLLERVILDEMKLENSHNRNRTIGTLALAALKALEVGELEQRIAALEETVEKQVETDFGT